jgi:hypothetical protein
LFLLLILTLSFLVRHIICATHLKAQYGSGYIVALLSRGCNI